MPTADVLRIVLTEDKGQYIAIPGEIHLSTVWEKGWDSREQFKRYYELISRMEEAIKENMISFKFSWTYDFIVHNVAGEEIKPNKAYIEFLKQDCIRFHVDVDGKEYTSEIITPNNLWDFIETREWNESII